MIVKCMYCGKKWEGRDNIETHIETIANPCECLIKATRTNDKETIQGCSIGNRYKRVKF